jgi:hypothetical protein
MGNGPLPRGPGFLLAHKGLKRLLRAPDQVVQTRALELQHLRDVVTAADANDPDAVCMVAEMIIAFFLCLRTEDHVAGHLLWGDIYPQSNGDVHFWLSPGKSVDTYRLVGMVKRDDILDLKP